MFPSWSPSSPGTETPPTVPEKKKRKQRKGTTERGHARAILDARSVHVHYAGKVMFHTADGPRSRNEDLLNGAFDAIAVVRGEPLLLVQWTSVGGASARLRKVYENFVQPFGHPLPTPEFKAWCERTMRIEVWGWVLRKGFAVWRFDWTRWNWVREDALLVPPKRKTKGKSK